MEFRNIIISKVEFKQDYINIDQNVAISSEGTVFKIGDKVFHEGDSGDNIGIIEKFIINKITNDVMAYTTEGIGRISFLYHKSSVSTQELITEIQRIINLNGDEHTDGECLDMIFEVVEKEKEI